MSVTYFVAMPFGENEDGDLVPGEPVEAPTAEAAKARARDMAARGVGGLAFSRTGDPGTGEFQPAIELARFGRVPDELE
jgi:hypothetical protein